MHRPNTPQTPRTAAKVGAAIFLAATLAAIPTSQAFQTVQARDQALVKVWNTLCNPVQIAAAPPNGPPTPGNGPPPPGANALGAGYRPVYCQNTNDLIRFLRGGGGPGPCQGDLAVSNLCGLDADPLVAFAGGLVGSGLGCAQNAPGPDGGEGNLGLLDGMAQYSVGGFVTYKNPCGDLTLPTPLIPAGFDLGTITTPPFGAPRFTLDTGCQHEPGKAFAWDYNFNMALDVGLAVYSGQAPFYLAGSSVTLHITPTTFSVNGGGGGDTEEGCVGTELADQAIKANLLMTQANAYVKAKAWPVDGDVRYLKLSTGDWLLDFPGHGLGTLDFSETIASDVIHVGTTKFSFEATWVVLQTCPATTTVCAGGVVWERGDSLVTT
ncbi:MAG: hypothetical protein QOG31_1433 [Thermoplasmata archaeon]|nr:hypothetical protein [Thermoplasmata archaeon]